MNSEAASDNPGERGRGRPPKFSDAEYEAAAGYVPPGGGFGVPRTRRGMQDRIYAARAIIAIRGRYPNDAEGIRFLFDEERATAKLTLLAELGRVLPTQYGEPGFWQGVDYVLTVRPSVKDGIKHLRTLRLTGRPPPYEQPNPDDTARAILNLLEPFPDNEAYQILSRLLITYRAKDREP